MSFALPASLFVAIASAPRGEMVRRRRSFFCSASRCWPFAAWYASRALLLKLGQADASLQALTIAFPNLAGVGLPISRPVLRPRPARPRGRGARHWLDPRHADRALIVEMSLARTRGAPMSPPPILRSVRLRLPNPSSGPALGVLVSLVGLNLGPVIEACLLLIGHSAPGVAFFLTGLVLSAQPLS